MFSLLTFPVGVEEGMPHSGPKVEGVRDPQNAHMLFINVTNFELVSNKHKIVGGGEKTEKVCSGACYLS